MKTSIFIFLLSVFLTAGYWMAAQAEPSEPVLVRGTAPDRSDSGTRWYKSKDPDLLYRRIIILEKELKKYRQHIETMQDEVKRTHKTYSGADKKLREMNDRIQELSQKLNAAQAKETELGRQVKVLERNLKQSNAKELQSEIQRLNNAINASRLNESSLNVQLAKLKDELEDAQSALRRAEKHPEIKPDDPAARTAALNLQRQADELRNELKVAKLSENALRNEIEDLKRQQTAKAPPAGVGERSGVSQASMEAMRKANQTQAEQINILTETKRMLKDSLEKQEQTLKTTRADLSLLKRENETLEAKVRVLAETATDMPPTTNITVGEAQAHARRFIELEAELGRARANIQSLKLKHQAETKRYVMFEEDNELLLKDLDEATTSIQSLRDTNLKQKRNLAKVEDELEQLRGDREETLFSLQSLRKNNRSLTDQVIALRGENSNLEQQIAALTDKHRITLSELEEAKTHTRGIQDKIRTLVGASNLPKTGLSPPPPSVLSKPPKDETLVDYYDRVTGPSPKLDIKSSPPILQRPRSSIDTLELLNDESASPYRLVAAGDRLLQQGKAEDAETLYRKALNADKKLISARLGLAACRYSNGNLEQAESIIQEILLGDPDNAQALGLHGIISRRQGQLAKAERYLERAVELDGADPQLHNYLGIVKHDLKKPGLAIQHLKTAEALDPSHPEVQFNLAVLLSMQKQPDLELAKTHYKKAIRLGSPRDEKLEKFLSL